MKKMKFPIAYPPIGDAEVEAVLNTMRSGWITHGPRVEEFEKLLGAFLHAEHVVACSSGTAALHLALVAAGIGPGDEVLVPSLTYVATVNAVTYTGATPVLVDADPATWGMDISKAHLSDKTRAILVTHVYGVPCNMEAILTFAVRHNLMVFEDAAEAFGAKYKERACGTLGLCGTFSFYGNKIITTGEGGAVVTDDAKVAEALRFYRGQAQSRTRFWHSAVGFNYRMTDVHASIGIAQMSRVQELMHERQRVVNAYLRYHNGLVRTPMDHSSAPWLFTGCLSSEMPIERVMDALAGYGIETRPVFVPMHRLPMYLRPDEEFPVASQIRDAGVSFPTYPALTDEGVQEIINTAWACVGETK